MKDKNYIIQQVGVWSLVLVIVIIGFIVMFKKEQSIPVVDKAPIVVAPTITPVLCTTSDCKKGA